MLFQNTSGVLLHPTSLPSEFGIGDLGRDAHRWLVELSEMGQSWWQVLPLTPSGTAFSPYQGRSSFAGNPLLISPHELGNRGLLEPAELEQAKVPIGPVAPDEVARTKGSLLRLAAKRFLQQHARPPAAFEAFCASQGYWLVDYARYEAAKRRSGGAGWWEWSKGLRRREPEALLELDREGADEIRLQCVIQFFFAQQWASLREQARQLGIRIVGDVPIFVAHDSADVWADQYLFQLDESGMPTVVAGVPPDYFAEEGQRWGNPLYDWRRHEVTGFAWWLRRVRRTLEQADVLRVDHFRGLSACWEIPVQEKTAINGSWRPAPGAALLSVFQQNFAHPMPIIAEDLGLITEDVHVLRDAFSLPTMRILQFSFGDDDALRPGKYPRNCVAYTGTHDNDTMVGWYGRSGELSDEASDAERHRMRELFQTDGTDIHWTCIRELMQTQASAVIFPLQDILGLGSEARMNTPGTVGEHNWTWRFSWEQLTQASKTTLRAITQECQRTLHTTVKP